MNQVDVISEFEPFDYVRDSKESIYVVRMDLVSHGFVALKPVYSVHGNQLLKLPPPFRSLRPHGPLEDLPQLLDDDCIILPREELSLVAKWNSCPLSQASELPGSISNVTDLILSGNAKLYLYGSRLLNYAQHDSDWDFLITVPHDLRDLLDAMARAGLVSHLNEDQIMSLLDRYEYRTTCISGDCLRSVVKACIPFVQHKNHQIDFFAVRDGSRSPAPNAITKYRGDLEGIVITQQGESFLMPRRFKLAGATGTSEVWHFSWLLVGLEHLVNLRLRLSGLLQDDYGRVWFSPRISTLEVLPDAETL